MTAGEAADRSIGSILWVLAGAVEFHFFGWWGVAGLAGWVALMNTGRWLVTSYRISPRRAH